MQKLYEFNEMYKNNFVEMIVQRVLLMSTNKKNNLQTHTATLDFDE